MLFSGETFQPFTGSNGRLFSYRFSTITTELATHISTHQLHKIVKSQELHQCRLSGDKEIHPSFPGHQEEYELGVKVQVYHSGTPEADAGGSRV